MNSLIGILRSEAPYLLAMMLDFYALPILVVDTGSGILMLLGVIPLVCFAISVVRGVRRGFHVLFAVAVGVLFVPALLIFFNESAWVYAVGYGVVSFAGIALGALLRRVLRSEE